MTARPNFKLWLVITFVCLYFSGITIAVERHVPSQYSTIQAAIDDCNDGDVVIVAPGTYTGDGNRDIDFKGKAITVTSTNPNDPDIVAATIIDCQGTRENPHRGFIFHSSEGPDSILSGVTITNSDSGGIYCSGSSPTITNCTFRGNSAAWGGGMRMRNDFESSPTVTNCTFTNNSAYSGGGMYNENSSPTITNCTFSGNSADDIGGGMYNYECSPTITNCTFRGNSAKYGGGMLSENNSPTVKNCTFSSNWADYGGGLYNYECSSPTVTNCTFSGNSANYNGGGMENNWGSSKVTNCTFNNNSASNNGGGMYNYWGSSTTITNCTITNNSALNGPAIACNSYEQSFPSTVTMVNCIVWNGPDWLWNNDRSTITVTYSDVQSGWSGKGNIDVDPMFVNPDNNDFHLLPGSLCIDRGDRTFYFGLEPEPDGGRINMGAYGNTPQATCKYGLILQSYNLVSKTRIGRTVFEYVYKMTLSNNSAQLVSNVCVELLDVPNNITILDPDVSFTYIAPGQSAESDDTFSIVADRSIPVDATIISWRAMYNMGPSDGFNFEDLAVLAEQWLGPPGTPSADISPQPDGDGIVNFKDFAVLAQHWLRFEPGTSNFPPGVSITSPEDGYILDEPCPQRGPILIEAEAWDYDGIVEWVVFLANGNWIGADYDGSDGWKINWEDYMEGEYLLTAEATDDDDATTTSQVVEIYIPPCVR